ncbi:MAG TPA: ligase-associated DNA damage response endonuclease PdeM [Chthoniobacterales bacterium]|nr:ligase-associated DNA damage response endonuclease PdeM [Chthoniobacterales bacterium]
MPDDELPLLLAGQDIVALAESALFWPRERTLFVADVHFGKDATFRNALRWVPPGTTTEDSERLSRLVERYRAAKLVILGDAFHSEHAREDATLQELHHWRKGFDTDVLMVRGNHDRRAGGIARELGFEMVDEGHPMEPFALHHHPVAKFAGGYVLCGHLHPVAAASGLARQRIRLPCFWIAKHQCVLPAFGGFTGGSSIRPSREDQVILVADGKLIAADLRQTRRPPRP